MKGQWSQWRTAFLIIIAGLCLVFWFVRRPDPLPGGLFATPTPAPSVTPMPTETPVATPVPGAVTIYAGETPVLTLAHEQEAGQLLQEWLAHYDALLPAGETLLYTEFKKPVSVRAAAAGEEPIPFLEARALLEADPSLCAVRALTRSVQTETLAFSSEKTEDKRLAAGTRIVEQVGRTGYDRVITTHTYVNGQPAGQPEIRTDRLPPIDERIAVGVYSATSATPGRREGERGKAAPDGFALALPFEGEITSNFGMRKGKMHNGLDIDCEVGDGILAPADGTVLFVGERSSYGLVVEISHGDGFVSRLAPLQDVGLQAGDRVQKGQQVGALSPPFDDEDSAHLHWELLIEGVPYNPRYYF